MPMSSSFPAPIFGKSKAVIPREISFSGEVLDIFSRAKGSWINLLVKDRLVSVWAPKGVKIPPVKYKGGYNTIGDTIEVKGILTRDFKKNTGPVVTAKVIERVKPGCRFADKVLLREKNTALVLFASFLACALIFVLAKGGRKNAE